MNTIFPDFLRPPKFDDAETTRIASQLHFVLLSGIFTSGSISVITFFFNYAPEPAVIGLRSAPLIPTLATAVLVLLYFMLRLGRVKLIIVGIILLGFASITGSLFLSRYGIRDTSAAILLLLLVLSSVYLHSQATLGFGILSLVIVLLVWFAEFFGIITTVNSQVPLDALLILITGISFSTIFLQTTVNRIIESSTKIREQTAALETNNQELREAQQALKSQTVELSRLNEELKREIAEREITESVLRQRQKLDSIGVLAGGVAHDFNNLLTGVIAQSTLALRKVDDEHPAATNIAKAIDSAKRGENLTRQLLAYAGRSQFLTERLNLNAFISENRGLLESLIQHSEVIEYQLAEPLPNIFVDRGQIQQVLMNLVMNASQAIRHEDGHIYIRTEAMQIDTNSQEDGKAGDDVATALFMGNDPPPGDYVVLSVEDNGQGMDLATQEKVFDPYFTTKESGHGLGLSALAGIVRSLNGGVRITSELGNGCNFSIYLPVANSRPVSKLGLHRVGNISASSEPATKRL